MAKDLRDDLSYYLHDGSHAFRFQLRGKLSLASGVTSKPAIEGHFKTGQRTITLDELVLPYRLARWQVQFQYQHGIFQDLIPVFPFLGRELRFKN